MKLRIQKIDEPNKDNYINEGKLTFINCAQSVEDLAIGLKASLYHGLKYNDEELEERSILINSIFLSKYATNKKTVELTNINFKYICRTIAAMIGVIKVYHDEKKDIHDFIQKHIAQINMCFMYFIQFVDTEAGMDNVIEYFKILFELDDRYFRKNG